MASLVDPERTVGVPATPKGPTGLLRALATASTPTVGARELPLYDASTLGGGASMFAYDPLLALDLDGRPLVPEE